MTDQPAALDQPTLEALDALPDQRILDLAVDLAHGDDQSEEVVLTMLATAAAAEGSDQLDDHRAVTAAVAALARATLRDMLPTGVGWADPDQEAC